MIGWILLLYFMGLALLIAEVFVPGGICGAIGIAMMIAGVVMGCIHYPAYSLFIVLFGFTGGLIGFVVGLKLFPSTPMGRLMIHKKQMSADDGYVACESDLELIGQVGHVFSPLRPAGNIQVGQQRYDAVSDGCIIEKGAKVRIIEVHGSRIVVEEISEG